jgi:hypothetical protein
LPRKGKFGKIMPSVEYAVRRKRCAGSSAPLRVGSSKRPAEIACSDSRPRDYREALHCRPHWWLRPRHACDAARRGGALPHSLEVIAMQCPQCQCENLPDAAFCENCGTKLAPLCPQCQADNRVPSQFCCRCGTLLTRQSPTPRSSLLDEAQEVHASQSPHIAPLLTEQRKPEVEHCESREIIYPWCCGLYVQRRKVVACLCLYHADGQVHKEIRTFGT